MGQVLHPHALCQSPLSNLQGSRFGVTSRLTQHSMRRVPWEVASCGFQHANFFLQTFAWLHWRRGGATLQIWGC